jgi:transcription initiation factor TFIID TATA-box-binding protein
MDTNITIVNVVGTGELEEAVNLEHLFYAAKDEIPSVQYDPVHHQGCYLRFREDGPLITVYNSGKYIIRAGSVEEVQRQREMLLEHLSEMGVPDTVNERSYGINNIVGNATLNREIALDALAEDLTGGDATYSESNGRIEYHLRGNKCTINIFRTGSVVIMGAPTVEHLEDAWERLTQEVDILFEK